MRVVYDNIFRIQEHLLCFLSVRDTHPSPAVPMAMSNQKKSTVKKIDKHQENDCTEIN